MKFPEKYPFLEKNIFKIDDYSIVPIRFEDRYVIMKWRNDQIYHLRQNEPLTKEKQDTYYKEVVSQLFLQRQPDQILFSYLYKDKCIGYGGLVHINWKDNNAEVSFIMDTLLQKKEFKKHWSNFLNLLENVAFKELVFHKIYTYAFDLRPLLYETLESVGFKKEAILTEHCLFEKKYIDVVVHSKFRQIISFRRVNEGDVNLLYEWANDEETRKNSFSSDKITIEKHKQWFQDKLKSEKAEYYIGEVNDNPAGLVRFDLKNNNEAIVGICIASNFRGKRLAASFLIKACEIFRINNPHQIIALIKENNEASLKAFERAFFIKKDKVEINGAPSYVYVYEK